MMNNELVIFETKDNDIKLDVPVYRDTVWFTQAQMTELFKVDRTVITRHVNNVFKEQELIKKAMCKKCTLLRLKALHQECIFYQIKKKELIQIVTNLLFLFSYKV